MAVLYCVPLGQTARRLFYQQMQQSPYEDSILILPNRSLRLQAQQEAPVNCGGIDELASKVLNKNGYVYLDEINRRSQELVTQELLNYLGEKSQLEYFQRLIQKKGFVKAAASLLGQLSRSGATEKQIHDTLMTWNRTGSAGEKDREIAQLYVLYRTYLKNNRWFDLEGKYRLAISVLAQAEVRLPWKQIYISDFYSFDVLQLEFLRALSRHCQLTIGLMYEPGREEVFRAAANTYAALAGFCTIKRYEEQEQRPQDLAYLSRHLFTAAEPALAQHISLYRFKSREEEVRWTLTQVKKLLQQGTAPKQILLTVRSLSNYSGIRQIADEYGVLVSLANTASLAVQPLTEFIQLLLRAADSRRQGAEAFFALLSSELGKLLFVADTEGAESLRQNRYYTSRRQLQEDYHQQQEQTDSVLEQTEALLAQLPQQARLGDYLKQLTDFISALQLPQLLGARYRQGELTLGGLQNCLAAQGALLSTFEQLLSDYQTCGLGDNIFTLAQLRDIVQEALQKTEIELAPGRTDGVNVAEIVNVQGKTYEHIFLLGVREGEFPSGSSENWLYNDQERAELTALGIDMPTTAQAYAEDAYFLAAAVAQCSGQLTVSWHQDDAAGASSYVEEISKLFDLPVIDSPEKLPASMREILSQAQLYEKDWLAQQLSEAALTAAGADKMRSETPVYNGQLSGGDLLQTVRHQVGDTFSPSRLEVYAACPFSFLGQYVWGGSGAGEKSETLEPADEGSLLHNVLARFTGRHLNEKLSRFPLAQLQEELAADFAALFEACAEQQSAASNVFWQADRQRLLKLLQRWLQFEYQQQQEFLPAAVELSFKKSQATALILQLPDGSKAFIEGRIDRIDRSGAYLFVTDYKRSLAPSSSDLPAGLDLQLPVYLLAAAGLQPQAKVAGGGYLVLKDTKRQAVIGFDGLAHSGIKPNNKPFAGEDDPWQHFTGFCRQQLSSYVEAIYQGDFKVQPQKACSAYCPLKNICRIGILAGQRREADG